MAVLKSPVVLFLKRACSQTGVALRPSNLAQKQPGNERSNKTEKNEAVLVQWPNI
jgi:hypothetical protein